MGEPLERRVAKLDGRGGVGNAKRRAIPYYNNMATQFMDDFDGTGSTRESVTHVICTHLHFDHVGWNTRLVEGAWVPTLPNAR